MSTTEAQRCAVIGSGPNGLAAGVRMAQAGCRVTVYEAHAQAGGGCRSAEMTLPGFIHDHCSAIHPLGLGSPYLRTLPLAEHGLDWIQPPIPLAHPLDEGNAALLHRSLAQTAQGLGRDSNAYMRLFAPIAPTENEWDKLCEVLLHPMRALLYPFEAARFGANATLCAAELADRYFKDAPARALIAGMAAHSFLPLDRSPSAAFALALGVLGHSVGWPISRGGSQKIADALISLLRGLGGEIVAGRTIASLDELDADIVLADINAAALPSLCGGELHASYAAQIAKFEPAPGVYKLDYALDGPVPWSARECLQAGTVHLGGTFEEIAAAEEAVANGEHPVRPYVLAAQQSLFDATRAPDGRQTLWAYCHVPRGSSKDMTAAIEAQIERFAPGFSSRILARTATSPQEFEQANANLIGGDISGGAYTLRQMLARPSISIDSWRVPLASSRRLYLCSASTPPGGGVHGMCGYYAAQAALGKLWI